VKLKAAKLCVPKCCGRQSNKSLINSHDTFIALDVHKERNKVATKERPQRGLMLPLRERIFCQDVYFFNNRRG
jgi:hypothetical protein